MPQLITDMTDSVDVQRSIGLLNLVLQNLGQQQQQQQPAPQVTQAAPQAPMQPQAPIQPQAPQMPPQQAPVQPQMPMQPQAPGAAGAPGGANVSHEMLRAQLTDLTRQLGHRGPEVGGLIHAFGAAKASDLGLEQLQQVVTQVQQMVAGGG